MRGGGGGEGGRDSVLSRTKFHCEWKLMTLVLFEVTRGVILEREKENVCV